MTNQKNNLLNKTDFAIVAKFLKKNTVKKFLVQSTESFNKDKIYDGRPTISEEILNQMIDNKIAQKSDQIEGCYIVKIWGECNFDWSKIIVSKNRPWEITELYKELNFENEEDNNLKLNYWDISNLKSVQSKILNSLKG